MAWRHSGHGIVLVVALSQRASKPCSKNGVFNKLFAFSITSFTPYYNLNEWRQNTILFAGSMIQTCITSIDDHVVDILK